MKIYITHSRNFDYKEELYKPLKDSHLARLHSFIFPHDNSNKPYNSKDIILNKKCDLVLAEVSYPSTGQGIELGWANINTIPIVCIYKKGAKYSHSLGVVCSTFIEYTNSDDMVKKLILEIKI